MEPDELGQVLHLANNLPKVARKGEMLSGTRRRFSLMPPRGSLRSYVLVGLLVFAAVHAAEWLQAVSQVASAIADQKNVELASQAMPLQEGGVATGSATLKASRHQEDWILIRGCRCLVNAVYTGASPLDSFRDANALVDALQSLQVSLASSNRGQKHLNKGRSMLCRIIPILRWLLAREDEKSIETIERTLYAFKRNYLQEVGKILDWCEEEVGTRVSLAMEQGNPEALKRTEQASQRRLEERLRRDVPLIVPEAD